MTQEEAGIKHLELIQGVINRMANNSFLLKGWTVTLIAALFALAAHDTDIQFSILTVFPALAFWGLDAYYLRRERLYRRLYEAVCQSFSENRSIPSFSLNTKPHETEVDRWAKILFTPTISLIHGTAAVLAAYLILY